MLRWIVDGFRSLVQLDGELNLEERRAEVRLRCRYDVTVLTSDRETAGVVIDISPHGLHVEVPEWLKVGRQVVVTRADTEPGVICRVVWRRQSKEAVVLGLQRSAADQAGTWLDQVITELGFDAACLHQKRRHLRVESSFAAAVEGQDCRGMALNLGAGGVLLELERSFPPGCWLELVLGPAFGLEPLTVAGSVVRCQETEDETYAVSVSLEEIPRVALLGEYVRRALDSRLI